MNEFFRTLFLIYFISHIPITLLIDMQAVFGAVYPTALRDIITWYGKSFNDVLMSHPPIWFKSFIVAETFLQLPFFFFAIWGLVNKNNIIRIPGIIYGAHVATTVWTILCEFQFHDSITPRQKLILSLIYMPYFAVPLLFTMVLAWNPRPWRHRLENGTTEIKLRKE